MTKQPTSSAVAALKAASKGLRMPSETDAPFTAFAWDDTNALSTAHLLQLAQHPKGTAVAESSLNDLFTTVPSEDQAKFEKLRQALQDLLATIRVFKVGNGPECEVYIVGKTKDGKWAGLRTTVVET